MNPVLRHLALRLWLTALAGGLLCLVLLPWWQRALGIQWLTGPSLLVLAASFSAVGWGMNRMGMIQLRRHLKEAAVWERAGMTHEARATFQKAVALFDSFWLSPLLRRDKRSWFQGVLARFYLGPSSADLYARAVVAGYLIRNPVDSAVVEHWLEQLLIYSDYLPEEHEAAERVGNAMDEHPEIQRRLLQFYLASGRMDFEARQTCRRVWLSGQPMSDEQVCKLSRMLLEALTISPWALAVYLKAHAAGETGAREGVGACVRWLPATEENQDNLTAAKALLDGMDRHRLAHLTARFEPARPALKPRRASFSVGVLPPFSRHFFRPLTAKARAAGDRIVAVVGAGPTRTWLLRVALAMVLVSVVGTAGWYLFSSRPPEAPPEAVTAPEPPQITDPFTIQVAAYLQAADAQRFVDQLKDTGLAAFWTRAASANRTWYQVKVAHFATKAEAQAYGRALKSKGLIDDFYVANFEPPATEGS